MANLKQLEDFVRFF